MSFDPQLFDQHLFGSESFSGVFDGAIFDSAMFDAGEEGSTPVFVPVILGGDEAIKKHRRLGEERREAIKRLLTKAYGGDLPESVEQEVKALAAPYVEEKANSLKIDWKALTKALDVADALLAIAMDEDDVEVLLLQ